MDKETKLPSNSFTGLLQHHRDGFALDEMSAKLTEVVEAVRQTGKGGELTIKIKITPASRGSGNAIVVKDDIKTKLPQLEKEVGFFFATEDNQLVRENPNQKQLQLRTVDVEATVQPLREAAGK